MSLEVTMKKRCETLEGKTLPVIVALAILIVMPIAITNWGHDTAFALTSDDCSSCHTGGDDGNMADEHHDLYYQGIFCLECHFDSDGFFLNTSDCIVCHSSESHEAAHDQALTPEDCSGCHAANVVTEHADHGMGCGVCHDSPDLQDIIDAGKNGVEVYCADCHVGFENHTAQHDQTALDRQGCSKCHEANVVTEHENHSVYCSVCHENANPLVVTAINKGIAGETVFCTDCHPRRHHHGSHDGSYDSSHDGSYDGSYGRR